MSEPETVTLANWIRQVRPVTVLSFHSAGGLVMGGPLALQVGLVDAYLSAARGYVYQEWSYYPVTGDFAQWAEDQGIPTVEVELLTTYANLLTKLIGVFNGLEQDEVFVELVHVDDRVTSHSMPPALWNQRSVVRERR